MREISGQLTNNSSALVDLSLIVLSNYTEVLDTFLAERFKQRGDAFKLALVHPTGHEPEQDYWADIDVDVSKGPQFFPVHTAFPTTISPYQKRFEN